MEYKVTSIKRDEEAQWGKRKVYFTIEGNDKDISGFFKFIPKVGDTLHGDIVPNGNYLNFKFGEKTHETTKTGPEPSPDILRVERKVDALMTELQMMRGVMGDILSKVDKDMDGSQGF